MEKWFNQQPLDTVRSRPKLGQTARRKGKKEVPCSAVQFNRLQMVTIATSAYILENVCLVWKITKIIVIKFVENKNLV